MSLTKKFAKYLRSWRCRRYGHHTTGRYHHMRMPDGSLQFGELYWCDRCDPKKQEAVFTPEGSF